MGNQFEDAFDGLPTAPAPGAATTSGGYEPGVCNIGPAEIERRRRSGHVGLAAGAVIFAGLVAVHAPPAARLVLVLPVGVAASGYLQAHLRFCAGFGSRGLFNFGPLGTTRTVADPAALAKDHARAREIVLASLGIGAAAAIAAALLPL